MKYIGDDIERLIPQRPPFMMVDSFEPSDEGSATTTLAVSRNNYFVGAHGEMAESGIIEHQAQSVSALAGYNDLMPASADGQPPGAPQESQERKAPPIGIIGEVKHFECVRRPRIGERLVTVVKMGMSFANVTMARCETSVDGQTIASINLKVFMQ